MAPPHQQTVGPSRTSPTMLLSPLRGTTVSSRRRPRPNTSHTRTPTIPTPTTPLTREAAITVPEADAEVLARRLQHATDLLLNRLLSYLSHLLEFPDETSTASTATSSVHSSSSASGGMTLPLTAVAWLSSQYFPPCNDDEVLVCPTVWSSKSIKDRLQKLQPLLSRITHLRITSRMEWPPPLVLPKPTSSLSSPSFLWSATFRNNNVVSQVPITPCPPDEVNVGVWSDVSSVLTVDDAPATTPTTRTGTPAAVAPPPTTSRRAFCEFIHRLNQTPICDARLFPHLQVLVVDAVDPFVLQRPSSKHPIPSLSIPTTSTVTLETMFPHFHHQWNSTLQLLKWNQSNLSVPLTELFVPPNTLPPSSWSMINILNSPEQHQQQDLTNEQYPVSSVEYSQLTHLDLSHSQLCPTSGLEKILPLFPNLKAVNVSYNQLGIQAGCASTATITDSTAADHEHDRVMINNEQDEVEDDCSFLLGLRCAAYLQQLNLSHNGLRSSSGFISQAHLYLGGQLIKLDLSYNKLSTVTGLDRMFALQELRLNHNKLTHLSELAGLCRLPQLQSLFLQGNRALEELYPLYTKQLWEWCFDYRQAMLPSELPLLNGMAITTPQWNALVTDMIPTTTIMAAIGTTPDHAGPLFVCEGPRKVQRRKDRTPGQRVRIALTHKTMSRRRKRDTWPENGKQGQTTTRTTTTKTAVSFSLQDVLLSLHGEAEEEDLPIKLSQDSAREDTASFEEHIGRTNGTPLSTIEYSSLDGVWDVNDQLLPLEPIDEPLNQPNEMDTPPGAEEHTEASSVSISTKEKSHGMDQDDQELANDHATRQTATSVNTPLKSNGAAINGAAALRARGFNVMTAEWDELVERVAGGMIPDGKPRMPIPDLAAVTAGGGDEAPFPEEAADLLPAPDAEHTMKDLEGASVATLRSTLPNQIYPDDCSVPSSLGTNREDFPLRQSKFQMAEENATYDGPDAWAKRNVLENLKDYFDLYVFRFSLKSMTEMQAEMEEDEYYGDRWENLASMYPRIQLIPEDRRAMEMSSTLHAPALSPASFDIDRWSSKKETFVRLWAEDIIPCGGAALRRLAPNRRPRLSFHGDQLYAGGEIDPYAECRKVYICISSLAFYIIVRKDAVMTRMEEKVPKKKFPRPISADKIFEDAPWPHAVARHAFHELKTVTIGFEFQRLTLHFTSPVSHKADPFVYVLLTSNKRATVTLLQDIQKLTKEAKPEILTLTADATPSIAIENDSQDVMDSLQAAVSPELVGTIFHYQIIHQRWKHGEERGTVRRVCVVTDSKLFLMDEDYYADSHQPLSPPATGGATLRSSQRGVDLAKVSYRLVDHAFLNQVSEVQAAGADPKAITIMIKPSGRLARTHRWRLICRDSVGAERLVEDVRKAMAMLE